MILANWWTSLRPRLSRYKVQQLAKSLIVFNKGLQNSPLIDLSQLDLVRALDRFKIWLTFGIDTLLLFLRYSVNGGLEGAHKHFAQLALVYLLLLNLDLFLFGCILCLNQVKFQSQSVDLVVLLDQVLLEVIFYHESELLRVIFALNDAFFEMVAQFLLIQGWVVNIDRSSALWEASR